MTMIKLPKTNDFEQLKEEAIQKLNNCNDFILATCKDGTMTYITTTSDERSNLLIDRFKRKLLNAIAGE